jgi:prepilin signal peptidase PulO-like enzyme (type II secretory pathway)
LTIILLTGLLSAVLWWRKPDEREQRLADFDTVLNTLLLVLVPYAAIVLLAWVAPMGNVRTNAIKVLTGLRPWAITGATLFALSRSPNFQTMIVLTLLFLLQMITEPVLEWWGRRTLQG